MIDISKAFITTNLLGFDRKIAYANRKDYITKVSKTCFTSRMFTTYEWFSVDFNNFWNIFLIYDTRTFVSIFTKHEHIFFIT